MVFILHKVNAHSPEALKQEVMCRVHLRVTTRGFQEPAGGRVGGVVVGGAAGPREAACRPLLSTTPRPFKTTILWGELAHVLLGHQCLQRGNHALILKLFRFCEW